MVHHISVGLSINYFKKHFSNVPCSNKFGSFQSYVEMFLVLLASRRPYTRALPFNLK